MHRPLTRSNTRSLRLLASLRCAPIALLAPTLISLPLLFASLGCKSKATTVGTVTEATSESFTRHWRAIIPPQIGNVRQLHLLDDSILVYVGPPTGGKGAVFNLSRSSGAIRYAIPVNQVDHLGTPIVFQDSLVIPVLNTLQIYSLADGKLSRTIAVPGARRANITTDGTQIYVPADTELGPRLIAIDPLATVVPVRWQLVSNAALTARPLALTTESGQTVIFTGSEDGSVTAATPARTAHWDLPGSTFRAAAAINADITGDPTGIYIASTDTKLYRLSAATGKIVWQFFAEYPLQSAPVVVGDTVFLQIPRTGLVAIPAGEGKFNRPASWTAEAATQFLSADDKYVYVRLKGNALGALDRKTGKLTFRSQRSDLDVFIPNTKDATIYAATAKGEVLAIKPVLRPGLTGELVLHTTPTQNSPAYGG